MKNSYAVIAGINKYKTPGNDLAGCINDAGDWAGILRASGVPDSNMTILLDSKATQANIIAGLVSLMKHKTAAHRLVVCLDSCHSESADKNLVRHRHRSIPYPGPSGEGLPLRRFGIRQDSLTRPIASPKQKHILLAACKDHQTAADATFAGRPNGAFTWALMQAIAKCGLDARIHDLFTRAKLLLKKNDYSQVPVIEGPAAQREMPLFADNLLLFVFSGHGSQIQDISGDEQDCLDECICSFDHDWNDPFTDDKLRKIFGG